MWETGSEKGRRLLENFCGIRRKIQEDHTPDFRKMLGAIAHYEGRGMTREEAELEAFRETTEGR